MNPRCTRDRDICRVESVVDEIEDKNKNATEQTTTLKYAKQQRIEAIINLLCKENNGESIRMIFCPLLSVRPLLPIPAMPQTTCGIRMPNGQ